MPRFTDNSKAPAFLHRIAEVYVNYRDRHANHPITRGLVPALTVCPVGARTKAGACEHILTTMQRRKLVLMTVLALGCYRSPLLGRSPNGGTPDDGTVPSGGSEPVASGQFSPGALALDEGNVYWLNLGTRDPPFGDWRHSSVMKCSKNGCSKGPTTLVHGRTSLSARQPAFATDGSYVYWSDGGPDISDNIYAPSGGILRCRISGCGNVPQLVTSAPATGLAVGGSSLFLTHDAPKVDVYPTSGAESPSADLWSGCPSCHDYSIAIAADRTDVFWTTTTDVMRCAQTGCAGSPSLLLPSSPPILSLGPIALDGGNVYFGHGAFDVGHFRPGEILACPTSGCDGSPRTVATDLPPSWNLATDGIDVYWSQTGDDPSSGGQTGMVRRCPVSGCAGEPETIASGIRGWIAVAVDATFVYWTDAGEDDRSAAGRIWRMPKS